jgi:tol-pal system protein YbgF
MLAGCATTSETDNIQQNLAILNERQAAIESRLVNAEGASQKGGDLYARIEELQTKMRTLNGRLEEVEHKLDQLHRAQASAGQGQAQQPGASPAPVVLEEGPVVSEPTRQQIPAAAPPVRPEASGAAPAAPAQAQALQIKNAEQTGFDAAVRLLQEKKYEAARKEFQAFVSRFPGSGLEESALYDIGECYFSEKRYEDAIKAYQQIIDKYPKGSKTASALLKQGIGWQNMGETTMARIVYTRLVEKYPGTAQAQAASKRLQQM